MFTDLRLGAMPSARTHTHDELQSAVPMLHSRRYEDGSGYIDKPTGITSDVDLTPASEATDERKVQLQANVMRTKIEITEVMNKTGTIVQRRITQGVQE